MVPACVLFAEIVHIADPAPHDGALNMAIDELLLRNATAPLVRTYSWARPSVSFGYFGSYAETAAAWPEHALVRRWTGGGIVCHDHDLTYTLIVPPTESLFTVGIAESYRLVHEAVLAALPGARLRESRQAESGSGACFENPVQHDLERDGRKVAGAAQRRTRWGLLHQGSLLVESAIDLPAALAKSVRTRNLSADELAAAETLAASRYGAVEWLQRR